MMAGRCASQTSRVYLLWIFAVHIDRREKTRWLIRLTRKDTIICVLQICSYCEKIRQNDKLIFGAISFNSQIANLRFHDIIFFAFPCTIVTYARVFDFIINVSTFKWTPGISLQQTERKLQLICLWCVPSTSGLQTHENCQIRAMVTFHPVTHVNLYNKNQIFQPSRPNRNFHEIAWRYLSQKRERQRES